MASNHLGVRLAKSEVWKFGDSNNVVEISERKFKSPSNLIVHEVNVAGAITMTPLKPLFWPFAKTRALSSYGGPYVIFIYSPNGKDQVSVTGPFTSPLPFRNVFSIRLLIGYHIPNEFHRRIFHSSMILGSCIYELLPAQR